MPYSGYYERLISFNVVLAEKELKINLIENFAQKAQNQSLNIDLSIFSCYNGY